MESASDSNVEKKSNAPFLAPLSEQTWEFEGASKYVGCAQKSEENEGGERLEETKHLGRDDGFFVDRVDCIYMLNRCRKAIPGLDCRGALIKTSEAEVPHRN